MGEGWGWGGEEEGRGGEGGGLSIGKSASGRPLLGESRQGSLTQPTLKLKTTTNRKTLYWKWKMKNENSPCFCDKLSSLCRTCLVIFFWNYEKALPTFFFCNYMTLISEIAKVTNRILKIYIIWEYD